MNTDTLNQIELETKRAPKEALIKTLDAKTQEMIRLALDPDVTFGVTAPDDDECQEEWRRANSGGNAGLGMAENTWDSWFLAQLHQFKDRGLSGNAAKEMVREIIQRAPSQLNARWAGRVINRQLRAGFDIKTFNRVFSKATIEKFSVQLADTYEGEQLNGLWYAQPKLDGNRVIILDGKAYSRNGKLYPAAQHIIYELYTKTEWGTDSLKKDGWVFDGEMMGNLGFDQSSGALRRLSEGGRKKAEFTYWVFDAMSRKEWEERKTRSYAARHQILEAIFQTSQGEWSKNIKVVPTIALMNPTHSQIMKLCDDYLKQGFEGAMLKNANSPYVFKRGKNLLKVKKFFDLDLRVVGSYEGKGKHKGRLGGLIVEGDGVKCEVGSGFSDELRETIWNDKKRWLGAIVQVQAQDKTPDGSLRFPVFLMRRLEKE